MTDTDIERRLAELCGLKIKQYDCISWLALTPFQSGPTPQWIMWHPLSNIEQSFMVVEAMRKANPFQPAHFELVQRPIGFVANFVGDPHYNEYANTPAEAICHSAIAALDSDHD